jgi:hypothetical protein
MNGPKNPTGDELTKLSRAIVEADKRKHDAKTARLREARLARDAREAPKPIKKLKTKKR